MQNSTPELQPVTAAPPQAPEPPLLTYLLCIDPEELKVVLIPSTSQTGYYLELSRCDAASWLEAKLMLRIPLSKRDWVRLADDSPPLPRWKW